MNRLCAVVVVLTAGACARGVEPQAGDRREEIHRYAEAVRGDASDPLHRYNLGTALLRDQQFEEARPHLERAGAAGPVRVRQAAWYNLGNSYLEPVFGEQVREGREDALKTAVEAYKRALVLDPGDPDAKWNLELARRMLHRPPPPPLSSPRQAGGGGGGGGADTRPGAQSPRPRPAGSGGDAPDLSPAAAERILSAARQQELGVLREKLRKPQPRDPSAH